MTYEKSLSISVDMEEEVNKEVRVVGFGILTGLIKSTPVDTGRARGNWFTSLTSPIRKIEPERKSATAVSDGSKKIDQAKNIDYPSVTLSNNLPYIERLNSGHSKQAPAKFVEQIIDRVVNSRKKDGR
jgi:hypothetical protein